jgi:hypothetical protein
MKEALAFQLRTKPLDIINHATVFSELYLPHYSFLPLRALRGLSPSVQPYTGISP